MGGRGAVVAAFLAIGVPACAGSPKGVSERPLFAQIAPGRRIVEERCAVCHGVHGLLYGQHPQAPRFVDLRERYSKAELAERLPSLALHGHGQMPPFMLTPDETDSLVAYIKSAR